jgi:TonB family protein
MSDERNTTASVTAEVAVESGLPPRVADVVVALEATEFRRLRVRRAAGAAAVLFGCALWYSMLGRLHATVDALPWYFTCCVIAVICSLSVIRATPFFFGRVRSAREPLSLLETWAASYFVAALALYAWVVVHELLPADAPPRMVQVVDIQLTSERDVADRKSPMPGTVAVAEMHKRQSDRTTMQGDLKVSKPAVRKVVPKPFAPQPPREDEIDLRTVKAAPYLVLPERTRSVTKPQEHEPMVLEEVQPPEMVEMIENDGVADAERVFLGGGSSVGGRGAENELSVYMKELHKRIKHAWSPPREKSREVRILFRIRKDGGLAFVRVTQSSGDADTDGVALSAVAKAVTTRKLPEDYQLPYLDVQYTFRYTADELKEITPRIIE